MKLLFASWFLSFLSLSLCVTELKLPDTPKQSGGPLFIGIRKASNKAHLCWAIKVAPTAFATDLECLKGFNKTQLVLVYGDIQPSTKEQKFLKQKVNQLNKRCRHDIETVALLVENRQSIMFKTVLNYIASYSLLQTSERCRECGVLKIQRRLKCSVSNVAIVYNNCIQHFISPVERRKTILDPVRLEQMKKNVDEALRNYWNQRRQDAGLFWSLYPQV
ncbi:uncharacterized protein LOC129745264 [Uranotaenia lowii]|uniref:uncharacterized protein LOC129745264 n=1 Tax=Uranotaenia lowii TaxID=190385 RepID=UPI00247924BA|nr:uncharacterized protein LOC129745264 [Uranotaenia lowii]